MSCVHSFRRLATSLVAIVSLAAAVQPSPAVDPSVARLAPPPAVNQVIEEGETAFLKAVLAKDTAALGRLLSEDFVYVHENGWISTKASFLRDYVGKGYVHAERMAKDPTRQYDRTVITISRGHLQRTNETPYPVTAVTHIWTEQDGGWRLVHRQESHKGEPIGKQLPPEGGGVNPTHDLGAKPSTELAKVINEREASWVYCMVTADEARMDKLVDASLHYVHVTDFTSTKTMFMKELMTGFTETFFQDATMRQYGDVVIVLHRARYRHTNKPEQSPSVVMHTWFKKAGDWVLVSRHGTRFASY
jgi:ketosteroid isomerase-like protein